MKTLNRIRVTMISLFVLIFSTVIFAACDQTATLSGIALSDYKTEFAYGEDFTIGDLLVKATYADGTEKTIDNYTVDSSSYNKTQAGEYTIEISYKEGESLATETYTVTVKASEEISSLFVQANKTEYSYGTRFVFSGVLFKEYTDGRREVAESFGIDSGSYNPNQAGEYEIIVSYGDLETSYMVKVLPPKAIESFEVNVGTTEFLLGMSFKFDGQVSVLYNDDTVDENYQDYEIDYSAYDAQNEGTYSIVISVEEISYSYNVTVVKPQPIKILMIGNSYSDDTAHYLPMIAEAFGMDVEIGVLYKSGCTLNMHYDNKDTAYYEFRYYNSQQGAWVEKLDNELKTLAFGIQYKDWDIISMQQASASSGQTADGHWWSIQSMIDYAKENATNSNVKLIWNMTWAYQVGYSGLASNNYLNQMDMYSKIVDAVQNRIATRADFEVILPVGTAIQNARTSYLGDTLNRDGTHLTYDLGRYIASMTLFCSLTEYSVNDITYIPEGVNSKAVIVAKESVENALKDKYTVTNSIYTA